MVNTWPGWEFVRKIGEGSYGSVYEIRREEFGFTQREALKVITIPRSPAEVEAAFQDGLDEASVRGYFYSFVEELVAEFKLMYQLRGNNTNIVTYEDYMVVQHEEDIGWDILIRMELLTPLVEYVRDHSMTEEDVIRLGIDICSALEVCASKGIIHRDIKPENIFYADTGHFKLGDFGVSKVVEKTVSSFSTKGTYNYMAPEVFHRRQYDFAVDVYSLGTVLYRFLNYGRLPFLPDYPEKIQFSDRERALAQRMRGDAMAPPRLGSEKLKAAVLKACAYDPADRFRSAAEFRHALEDAAAEYARQGSSADYDEVNDDGGKSVNIFSDTFSSRGTDAGSLLTSGDFSGRSDEEGTVYLVGSEKDGTDGWEQTLRQNTEYGPFPPPQDPDDIPASDTEGTSDSVFSPESAPDEDRPEGSTLHKRHLLRRIILVIIIVAAALIVVFALVRRNNRNNPEMFDAFANVTVEFSGISPDATAVILFTGDGAYDLGYSLNPSEGLANGDIVTVTVDDQLAEEMRLERNMYPEELSKDYVVKGLNAYVSSLEEIPAESMEALKEYAVTVKTDKAEEWPADEHRLDSIEYVGCYFLSEKAGEDQGDNNLLYLVYRLNVTKYGRNVDGSESDLNFDYYWYGGFADAEILEDGSFSVDYDTFTEPTFDDSSSFVITTYDYSKTDPADQSIGTKYRGYQDMDSLFEDLIAPKEDAYTWEFAEAD